MPFRSLPTAFTRRQSLALAGAALLTGCGWNDDGAAAGTLGQSLADSDARAFYAARNGQPAWDRSKADALMRIVGGAQAHGLAPAAFAPKAPPGGGNDEALTLAALGYARALASGFVEPTKVEPIFTLERNRVDLAAGLGQALDHGDLDGWFAALPPADDEYKALSAAYLAALGQAGLAAAPARGVPGGAPTDPAEQARQLAANLERRRWLARNPPAHRIDVSLATAELAYLRPGQEAWTTRVVVGQPDHPTPSLQATFHKLVANPPWRVPQTIAETEILPKGAGYLARQDMRVVDGRVVQAPGPKCALGQVKFDVEDDDDIYLHDTPAKALFARAERHRSHGCVRVENAVAFARSLAAETGRADAFDQALASKDTHEVELGQSIPVRLLYHTAWVDQAGQVMLSPDVYGTDDRLAAALGLGQAAAVAARRQPEADFGP